MGCSKSSKYKRSEKRKFSESTHYNNKLLSKQEWFEMMKKLEMVRYRDRSPSLSVPTSLSHSLVINNARNK